MQRKGLVHQVLEAPLYPDQVEIISWLVGLDALTHERASLRALVANVTTGLLQPSLGGLNEAYVPTPWRGVVMGV